MINYLDIWYLDSKRVECFGKFLDYDSYKTISNDVINFAKSNKYNYCFEKISSNRIVIKLWKMKGEIK